MKEIKEKEQIQPNASRQIKLALNAVVELNERYNGKYNDTINYLHLALDSIRVIGKEEE